MRIILILKFTLSPSPPEGNSDGNEIYMGGFVLYIMEKLDHFQTGLTDELAKTEQKISTLRELLKITLQNTPETVSINRKLQSVGA